MADAAPRGRARAGARAGFFIARCITYTLLYYPLTYSSPHTLLCVPGRVGSAHSTVEIRHTSLVTLSTKVCVELCGDTAHRTRRQRSVLSFVDALPAPSAFNPTSNIQTRFKFNVERTR